jgi:membrane protein
MGFRKYIKLVTDIYTKFRIDEISFLAAQVSYYLILSIFPFLIFLVTLVSYTNLVHENSLQVLSGFLPASVYRLILDVVKSITASRNTAFISLGMLATIWSSSIGILAFMYGMNKAYNKKETRPFWKVRALSVLFTLALAAILLLSAVLVVFGEILGRHLFTVLNLPSSFDITWDIFRYTAAIVTLFFVFALFYIYIPNCSLSFRSVLPGSALATAGWIMLSAGFAFYVNNFGSYSKIYGSIGAIIALLIWLYWSSMIVFIGSELNALLYNPGCRK